MVRLSIRNGKLGAAWLTREEGKNLLATGFYDGEKIDPEAQVVRDEFLRGYHTKTPVFTGFFVWLTFLIIPKNAREPIFWRKCLSLKCVIIYAHCMKIFVYLLSLILVPTFFFLSGAVLASEARAQSPQLIKGESSQAVYYLYEGKRYAFPNEQIFFSWYGDFSNIGILSEGQLASIPLGGNVTYRPGTRMVKITTDPRVYAVSENAVLRWVTSEAVARALYGENWARAIDDVPDALFVNYQIGDPIQTLDQFHVSEETARNPLFMPRRQSQAPTQPTVPSSSAVPILGGSTSTASVPLNPVIAATRTTSAALQELFNISATQPLRAEEYCSRETDVRQEYPGFFDQGRQRTLRSSDGRSIRLFIRTPDDSGEKAALADEGLRIIERMLPIYERWFGPYPCDNIYVNAFSNAAFGGPGFINVGGSGGVNVPDLLGHEFTHSYFHSSMSYSWLAEGAAQFLPSVNRYEQMSQGTITPREMYGDFPVFDFTFNDFISRWMNTWSRRSIEQSGATVSTRICDVEEDYTKASPLGKLFMQDTYLAIGQENYLRATETLYKAYRTTKRKNTYYDIFRTIQYFTPENTPASFLYGVRQKLCL